METSQFHAACEWFGPGWTVILSPLVHILRRPAWDLFLMSAHPGTRKKPASNTWPCLPTGTDASAAPTEGMVLPDADSGPTLGTQPPLAELSGQVGELAAELGVGWTGESYPPPRVALEAVRQSSPRQESVETVSVTKDRVPLRRSGAPAKKRRGAEAHPAGAVDFLRMRVDALRAGEERAPKTRRWLCRAVTERCLDCSADLAGGGGDATTPRRVFCERMRRANHKRRKLRRVRNEGRYAGPTGGKRSTIVSFARQVGYAQGAEELEAAANIQRLAVSYIDRALLAQAGPKFPVSADRVLRTLADRL